MIIDLHCDTLMKLLDVPAGGDLRKNVWNIDLEKLQKSNYLLQDFAIFVDLEEHPDAYVRYGEMRDTFLANIEKYGDKVRRVRTLADLEACRRDHIIGALLSVEEGGVFGGDLQKLKKAFIEDGVRLVTLTWNYENELAFPNGTEGKDKGLKARGWEFVEWMQANGMIVDTSHLNDQGTRELLERAEKPVMASHSNARAVFSHPRNLPEDLLRAFGEKGGVIGLNFSRNFVGSKPITDPSEVNNPRLLLAPLTTEEYHQVAIGERPVPAPQLDSPLLVSKAADIARHARYIADIAGIETVALGTDFDGIQPYLEIHDASEMDKLFTALEKEGFSADDIDHISHKNAIRFFNDTLPAGK